MIVSSSGASFVIDEGRMSVNVSSIDRMIRVAIGIAPVAYEIPLRFPNTGYEN
jgi:hypothetical protein